MTRSPQGVGDGRHNMERAFSTISYRCPLTAVRRGGGTREEMDRGTGGGGGRRKEARKEIMEED